MGELEKTTGGNDIILVLVDPEEPLPDLREVDADELERIAGGPLALGELGDHGDLNGYAAAAGAGLLLLNRGGSPLKPEVPNPLRDGPVLKGNPVLGTAVTVGGATLIYLGVDRLVSKLDPAFQGPAALGATVGIYEGLARLGITEGPQWGLMLRSAPHLTIVQLGASHLFDGLGLPMGSQGNAVASFGATTAAYAGLPLLAKRFPQLANVYRSSIGLTASSAAGAATFRGSTLLMGGLRLAGAVGMVLLVKDLGEMLAGVLTEAFHSSKDPDNRLWYAAEDFACQEAKRCGFFDRMDMGWSRAFSSDYERQFRGWVWGVVDRWIEAENQIAEGIDNGLLLAALKSVERSEDGSLSIDWEKFRPLVRQLFQEEKELVANAHALQQLIAPTKKGGEIAALTEIFELISTDGTIRDPEAMREYLDHLFVMAELTGRLDEMLEGLVQDERSAYQEGLASVNLLDGQTGRPKTVGKLSVEQKAFLGGEGKGLLERLKVLGVLYQKIQSHEKGTFLWDEIEPRFQKTSK
ncbi:MAG TPA: hypothetical protein VFX30_12925 [bacterium]|nr:hypothetical protein [bacterium]